MSDKKYQCLKCSSQLSSLYKKVTCELREYKKIKALSRETFSLPYVPECLRWNVAVVLERQPVCALQSSGAQCILTGLEPSSQSSCPVLQILELQIVHFHIRSLMWCFKTFKNPLSLRTISFEDNRIPLRKQKGSFCLFVI